MPVLPPSYLGSLQQIYVGNYLYLLEKFNQRQVNTLSDKQMIQGSLGVRVMDVGEIFWSTQVESSALIFGAGAGAFSDVFALIDIGWANIRSANSPNVQPALPLMEKASININKDGVRCSASFKSDDSLPFVVSNSRDASGFFARTAKWYDCTLIASSLPVGFPGTSNTIIAGIESAEIEFDVKITPRFFIGQSQTPFFSIDSYKVSGKMTVIASAADMLNTNNIIPYQTRGFLSLTGPVTIQLQIGLGAPITLGLASMKSEYSKSVNAGEVNKITISFTSYTS